MNSREIRTYTPSTAATTTEGIEIVWISILVDCLCFALGSNKIDLEYI